MFSCPHEDCTQPVTETVQRRFTTNSIIVMAEDGQHSRRFLQLARADHTVLSLSAPPQTESNGTFSLALTCCIVSTVLPVFSKRNAMICLAMSFYQTTGRLLFARRTHSPHDMIVEHACARCQDQTSARDMCCGHMQNASCLVKAPASHTVSDHKRTRRHGGDTTRIVRASCAHVGH